MGNGFSGSQNGGYREFNHMDYKSSFLPVLLFCYEDGDSIFLRNVGQILPEYTAMHLKTRNCSGNRVKVKLSMCFTSY
jgi:hypothetical protein